MQKPLTTHLKNEGTLVLSGLLENERDIMLGAPEFSQLKFVSDLQEGEWIALVFTKTPAK